MRILFHTSSRCFSRLYQATNRLRLVRQFPCQVIESSSPGKIARYIKDVDVVLLDYKSYGTKLPKDYAVLFNTFPGLIGGFYGDVWTGIHHFPDDLKLDMHITSFLEPLIYRVPHLDSWHFVPPCIDVYESSVPRDIDILTWGAITSSYPFRLFCSCKLSNLIVRETSLPKAEGVIFHKIVLNGKEYIYGHLPLPAARTYEYFTSKLLDLLLRTKISCTGPVYVDTFSGRKTIKPYPWYQGYYGRVIVGKYFEHAATGVVTISTEFSDMQALGFQHQKNLWITDESSFINDLTYLLEHNDVRSSISKSARQLIKRQHTTQIRAHEFYTLLTSQLKKCKGGQLRGRV